MELCFTFFPAVLILLTIGGIISDFFYLVKGAQI